MNGPKDVIIYTMILLKSVVAVSKRQVAILARSSRGISQTVHINCRSFLSRVRISVQPSKFVIGEKKKKRVLRRRDLNGYPVNAEQSSKVCL